MDNGVVVVGGGVSGLACARGLAAAGRGAVVVERASRVGGRCASRPFDGQLVDYGPLFFHGHQPAFLAALDAVEGATRLDGWPGRVRGEGAPCQPQALDPEERRLAFAEGVNAFPRHLATGLDVRLRAQVTGLEAGPDGWRIHTDTGGPLAARDVVLAMAPEQALCLLDGLEDGGSLASIRALLGMFASLPTLTVIAGYDPAVATPDWDLLLPDEPGPLLLGAVDSSKRAGGSRRVLVLQASPLWSRARVDAPAETWTPALIEAAARVGGDWLRSPLWTHPHRWRHGRLDRGTELASPVLTPVAGGRLGLCGDLFAPGGGVQAAYLSGERLAQRLIDEERG